MLVKVIETFKKLSGEIVKAGDVLDVSPEKVDGLVKRGRVRLLPPSGAKTASPDAPSCPDQGSGQATLPEAYETGQETANGEESGLVAWNSPVFGLLEAPVLSRDFETFTLIHPLTGEAVTLPNEWLVSMDERSAIIEYDGGIPRKEADNQAKWEFFRLFRKGGAHEKRD